MSSRNWTESQRKAIYSRKGTLLVSAAAGSGKTAVLTERVIEMLLDEENPVPADKLLILTYTNAAAGELRGRIMSRLTTMLSGEKAGLARRQRRLLEHSHIGTIHSYCLALCRQHFNLIEGLSPTFRLGDENELTSLMDSALKEVLEERYSEGADDFLALVELISGGRNDSKLAETLIKLYGFVRSHPYYFDWMDKKAELYKNAEVISTSPFGGILLDYATEAITYAYDIVKDISDAIYGDDEAEKAYSDMVESDMAFLEGLLLHCQNRDYERLVTTLDSYAYPRLNPGRKVDAYIKQVVKSGRDSFKEAVSELKSRLTVDNDSDFIFEMGKVAPMVECLFSLAKQLDGKYREAKSRKSLIDYSDLEHFALELLTVQGETGLVPTNIARELGSGYSEILVDECQDINALQDEIIKSFGAKMFYVGDVKQSIYRFRQARPELFIEKLMSFAVFDDEKFPASITLNDNFRCRLEICEGVNYLFRMLMSEKLGELDYDVRQRLNASAKYPDEPKGSINIRILDKKGETDEPRYIANLIAELMTQGRTVTDGGADRPLEYGDICILMRSPRRRLQSYITALSAVGIPVSADSTESFLTSSELMPIVQLLTVTDNPILDIELSGVMLSPLFGFTAEELADVRILTPGGNFYTAVLTAVEDGNTKVAEFVETLSELRLMSAQMSVSELVVYIYNRFAYEHIVSAGQNGSYCSKNLWEFVRHISAMEGRGMQSLHGIVSALRDLLENGRDLPPPSGMVTGGVRVMSIHRSKGLEFPVVMLAECGRLFNLEERSEPFALSSDLGFACVKRDAVKGRQYPTLALSALRVSNTGLTLSEELRALYVALTRAKEVAYVTMSYQNPQRKIETFKSHLQGDRLAPYHVRSGRSFGEWIMSALLHRKGAEGLLDGEAFSDELFSVELAEDVEVVTDMEQSSDITTLTVDSELKNRTETLISTAYRWENEQGIPSKATVTQLVKSQEASYFTAVPSFAMGGAVSGADRGNALHRFMQVCDLKAAAADADTELKRLEVVGLMSAEEAKLVDVGSVERFFLSSLWQSVKNSPQILREYPFMGKARAEDIAQFGRVDGDDITIVQGIADMVAVTDRGAVLIDFKTDRVGSGEMLKARYRAQLDLYKHLLRQHLRLDVFGAFIYSLHLGEGIGV